MGFSDNIKSLLRDKRNDIENFQLAVVTGIASLTYLEYLKNFKQRLKPTRKVFIPSIELVKDMCNRDSNLMKYISDNTVKYFNDQFAVSPFDDSQNNNYPELEIFRSHGEELSVILEMHILTNVERTIPRVISSKFGINDDNNQTFFEDPEIKMFDQSDLKNYEFDKTYTDFILSQIKYYYMYITKSIHRDSILFEDNSNLSFELQKNECITISNTNAVSTIYLDNKILLDDKMMELINFITGSKFEHIDVSNDEWKGFSSPFNTLTKISFTL